MIQNWFRIYQINRIYFSILMWSIYFPLYLAENFRIENIIIFTSKSTLWLISWLMNHISTHRLHFCNKSRNINFIVCIINLFKLTLNWILKFNSHYIHQAQLKHFPHLIYIRIPFQFISSIFNVLLSLSYICNLHQILDFSIISVMPIFCVIYTL